MRRVLRPGGRLGVAVWSTPDKVAHHLVARVVLAAAPPLPDAERGPSPHALGDPGLIERLVADAGCREVAVARHTREYVVADPEEEWRRRLEEPASVVARALETLPEGERRRLHDAAIVALEGFRRDGAIRLPSEAMVATGVR